MDDKRWFITKDGKGVQWVQSYIKKDIEYDFRAVHCIVAMENNQNSPDAHGCKVKEIDTRDFFATKKDAQMEIILRERFYKKGDS